MRTLIFSQSGVPTGYGRIADEIGIRLVQRGHSVMAASMPYDGLLPPRKDNEPLPYWVVGLSGKPWNMELLKVMQATNPELVIGIEDAPYLQQMMEMPYDWSKTKVILITPVDGVPIHPHWIRTAKQADAFFSISHFGVEAYRRAGVHNTLPFIPGANPAEFFQQSTDKREATRVFMKYEPKTFVLGTMAMNQGRKAISLMLKAFFNVVRTYPGLDIRYHLDMDSASPAGWDIPILCEQFGWDASRLTFRDKTGMLTLNDRYNMLDAHVVISHREGYGIPLVEAMACGVPSIAMDYCSGTEIIGEDRGVLIPAIDYAVPGTWGGAEDKFPDMGKLESAILTLAENRAYRSTLAKNALAWAQTQTWDASFNNSLWPAIEELK
jgi:glycosyltransferase involved in cell wall biosynthesis